MDSVRLILLVLCLIGAVAFIFRGIRTIKSKKNEALTLLMAGILGLIWAMLRIIYYKFPELMAKKMQYINHLGSVVSGALLVLLIIIVVQGIKNRQR